jgi:hypothetical protein
VHERDRTRQFLGGNGVRPDMCRDDVSGQLQQIEFTHGRPFSVRDNSHRNGAISSFSHPANPRTYPQRGGTVIVASWEFHALAVMHLAKYGDEAEAEAARRLHRAEELQDRGEMVVWREVGARLPKIGAEGAEKKGR